ncbi:6276_t:CDS:2, partial [Cetraspora pellucida]
STNKLYYFGPGSQYFSIDLTGVSLDGNSVISVKANDKIYFPTDSGGFIDTYDTTLNKWDMNISFTGRPSLHFESFRIWTSDENSICVGSDLNGPPQALVNSQLLYFGQPSGILGSKIMLMTSILAYN